MNLNLNVLEDAVKQAAKKGAQIIVTPEDGIYGWSFNREAIFPYLENIPDPNINWTPCTEPDRFGRAPVQVRLSCIAKSNSIYVAANIGDIKPCNATDPKCPKDGRYQYNTDVVFASDGKLVARYHKYHLFLGETQFDQPAEPKSVTFNTTFGTFGIFTCFDILFYKPAVHLVDHFQVDSVLFPTAWMNVLPHLTAIEFHSAWAMGMGVNFLAANTHNTTMNMTGSGIYAPDKARAYHYDAETDNGHLLIAKLDIHPKLSPHYTAVNWSLYAAGLDIVSEDKTVFNGTIFYDVYTFVALNEAQENISVCQKDLCCHLSYSMKEKKEDELYALGAFDGLHTVEGQYYLQVCTLVKCKDPDLKTCGEPVQNAMTEFEKFSLSGRFGTKHVFPEVLLSGVHLAPGEFEVLNDGRLRSENGTSKPVLSVTLFGRWYEKD
ncbi:VNN1 Pantetheinase, partial [Polyodon spathula]|nr:VNN1 Pantetheinase [Polyodon spathula]